MGKRLGLWKRLYSDLAILKLWILFRYVDIDDGWTRSVPYRLIELCGLLDGISVLFGTI